MNWVVEGRFIDLTAAFRFVGWGGQNNRGESGVNK